MKAIIIGASTGGPEALKTVLSKLPTDFPAVVIVIQHIPEKFAIRMAKRLGSGIALPVSLMKDGETLQPSHVYVVPGQSHFFVIFPKYQVRLLLAEDKFSPSINMGFTSVAEHFGPETIGVVLTGMGKDGVLGAKAIKQAGGRVIIQNESTSTVFGMPRAVKQAGLADETLSLKAIAPRLVELVISK